MSYNFNQHPGKPGQIWILMAAVLVLLMWAFGMATWASAQKLTLPAAPAVITPPPGNTLFLVGHAVGTQGYVCLPSGTGASWTVNERRPEASLFSRNSVYTPPARLAASCCNPLERKKVPLAEQLSPKQHLSNV